MERIMLSSGIPRGYMNMSFGDVDCPPGTQAYNPRNYDLITLAVTPTSSTWLANDVVYVFNEVA